MPDPNTDELDLVVSEGGTRLRLRVKARARRDEIQGVHAGALKLCVTAPAEKGKANKALLAHHGDEIIAAAGIFGGTVSLFQNVLQRFGVQTNLVNIADTNNVKKAINRKTKLIFVETIGNPRMDVSDISAIAELSREANIPLIVDNTVTTPALFQPGKYGADIVVGEGQPLGSSPFLGGPLLVPSNETRKSR